MLTDEQLIERIRSGLRTELSELHPPSDLLDRLHQPASPRRPRSRRPDSRSAAGRHRRVPSAGATLATLAAGIAVVVAVLALAVLGHGRAASTAPASSLKHGQHQLGPVLADCVAHGDLTHTYSRAQITRALATMPANVKKYTNCPVVLRAALHIVSTRPPPNAAAALLGIRVHAQLAGIAQAGRQLGDPKAPVTIVFFGDLECPICRDFALSSFTQLIAHDVRDDTVNVIYRSFCTATCNGPGSKVFEPQQAAAYAAGAQHLFWNYALLFYHEQGQQDTHYATASYLTGLAKQIRGLNLERWETDRSSPSLAAQVNADERAANSDGLNSTPTLIMYGPKGKKQIATGVPTYTELQRAIRQVR
jgi:protein-disulfide isomerase